MNNQVQKTVKILFKVYWCWGKWATGHLKLNLLRRQRTHMINILFRHGKWILSAEGSKRITRKLWHHFQGMPQLDWIRLKLAQQSINKYTCSAQVTIQWLVPQMQDISVVILVMEMFQSINYIISINFQNKNSPMLSYLDSLTSLTHSKISHINALFAICLIALPKYWSEKC